MEGVPSKGRSGRRGMAGGGVFGLVSEWDCWRALEQSVALDQSHPQ